MTKTDNFAERRKTADAAKARLLDKFRTRPLADDPAVLAKAAARDAIITARNERQTIQMRARQVQREAFEAEQKRAKAALAAEAAQAEIDRAAQAIVDEVEKKAQRDERYAARKLRKQG